MKIGEYQQRITFQKRETSINENGFTSDTWIDFYTCWSSVSNLSGQELFAAMQTQGENTVNFKVRYCSVLENLNTTDYRIMFKDNAYNITYIDFVNFRNKDITIKAAKLEVIE